MGIYYSASLYYGYETTYDQIDREKLAENLDLEYKPDEYGISELIYQALEVTDLSFTTPEYEGDKVVIGIEIESTPSSKAGGATAQVTEESLKKAREDFDFNKEGRFVREAINTDKKPELILTSNVS